MNSNTVRKAFQPSFGSLHSDAQRLLQALNDSTIGPPVVAHLPATFVTDFTTQIDSYAQAVVAQSGAIGVMSALIQSQASALVDLSQRTAAARQVALIAFPGEDAMLHGEFQVGLNTPSDLNSIVLRARKLLAACTAHAPELALHGWSAAAQTALSSAIDTVASITLNRSAATDAKHGATCSRNRNANTLYNQCRTVQTIAAMVYPASLAEGDAATVEARARFLVGEFPSRPGAKASPAPAAASPAAPAVVPASAPAPAAHPLAA